MPGRMSNKEMLAAISNNFSDIGQELLDKIDLRIDKLQHQMNRAIAVVQHMPDPEEPEPDPVLTSTTYSRLLSAGFERSEAYQMAEAALKAIPKTNGNSVPATVDCDPEAIPIVYDIPETPELRMQAVADMLQVQPGKADIVTWRKIEAYESQKGSGIQSVYYAILNTAKYYIGTPLAEYIRLDDVRSMSAPWDRGKPLDSDQETILTLEIGQMLADLSQYQTRADCQVAPRLEEVAEDGTGEIIKESLSAYHKRVQGRHKQMIRLKSMGVID